MLFTLYCKRSQQSIGCRQKGAGIAGYSPGACIQSRCLYLRKVKSVKYGVQQSPMQTVRITAREQGGKYNDARTVKQGCGLTE